MGGAADPDTADAANANANADADADGDTGPAGGTARQREAEKGRRDVIVPLRLYKTVTVFSTLFAVVFVLAGFVLLDAATNRATAELSAVDPVTGILGVASLAAGAAVYAFSTRFRTAGMGKVEDDADEGSGNG